MALQLFPDISKIAVLRDGTKYAYVHIPAANPGKPTFLLFHGFPNLLGYGEYGKPTDIEAYSLKRMAGHIVELLDSEGLGRVIGVGHDWGSTLLSIVALTHPKRFAGLVFTAVGYYPPAPFDLRSVNSLMKSYVGYPAFAYMEFFNEEDAAAICDSNPASMISMLYSTTPEDWKAHMGTEGGAKKWISGGKIAPPPPWMSNEEIAAHVQLFKKGGYTGPLNWYKSFIRGIDKSLQAEFASDASKNLDTPAVLVAAEYDCCSRPEFQIPAAEKHLSNRRIEILACSHWIPLEQPDQLVDLLDGFVSKL